MTRALISTGIGLAVLLALAGALALRKPESRRLAPRKAPVAVHEAPAPKMAPAVARAQAMEMAAKIFVAEPPKEVTRDEVFALIREAGAAHKARDAARYDAALSKLKEFGAGIQRWLAEGVLTFSDETEAYVAAVALFEVATADAAPFALALVRTDRPAAVLAIGIQLLTKFQVAEAAPVLEDLLFRDGDAGLRGLAVDYFAARGDVRTLSKAASERSLADLRRRAAEGLVRIGTPEAGTALLESWKSTFDVQAATADYFLLESLARFDADFLRGIYAEALRGESNASRLNVLLSALAKADRGFALEQVKTVLSGEFPRSVRGQALLVLGAMGGRDAQELLLDLLANPRTPKDFLDCANGLLQQETLEAAFERVTSLYSSAQDPLARAVLANLLARYPERLAEDRRFAMSLLEDAGREIDSKDPARRALGLQLSAALADFTPDAGAHLTTIYEKLKPEERDANAAVFAEMAKRGEDARLRPALESALADESAAPHRRLVAAESLLAHSGRELVFTALEKTSDGATASMLAGLVLARQGAEGARRLGEIAKAMPEGAKRSMLEQQLKSYGTCE